jgi:hypothetical protein
MMLPVVNTANIGNDGGFEQDNMVFRGRYGQYGNWQQTQKNTPEGQKSCRQEENSQKDGCQEVEDPCHTGEEENHGKKESCQPKEAGQQENQKEITR